MNTSLLPLAFIQNINGPEILLIFLIVLLLFGSKRLPELFHSLGKSIKEFKRATSDVEDDIRTAMDAEEKTKSTTPPKTKPAESKPDEEDTEERESDKA